MSAQVRRKTAALLEVFGVYVVGALLSDRIAEFLVRRHLVSGQNPFALLTVHASNADLLIASRQLLLTLVILYGAYFALILPINFWYRRRGPAAYGLTRAGRSWSALVLAALATACLTQWPVLIHTLVDAIHPLGPMAPWRQAFFAMSWRRWQFWLFAGILSYALIPVVEELIFRGYYQRRLAEDWGDGPAIVGTACFFTFAHRQYLIANAYNITMVVSLFCMALGLGIVFAWTRSLIPSILAHALINIPMTTFWQGALLLVFIIGIYFAWRGGIQAVVEVFRNAKLTFCILLALVETAWVLFNDRIRGLTWLAAGMLLLAIALEAIDHRRSTDPSGLDLEPEQLRTP
jgi:membrane protease YdiL (CAAX protease family)